MKLDESRARAAVEENIAKPLGISLESALLLMERAYHEKIAQGMAVFQEQSSESTLLAFGGAGPMSACGVAEAAGMTKVIVPRLAAVFSAFGISFSDIAHEYQATIGNWDQALFNEKLAQLKTRAERDMFAEGFNLAECLLETNLGVVRNGDIKLIPITEINQNLEEISSAEHLQVLLKVTKPISHYSFATQSELEKVEPVAIRKQRQLQPNEKWIEVPVYEFESMTPGTTGAGPALIEDSVFTCRVLEGWSFTINENKDIFLTDERRNS